MSRFRFGPLARVRSNPGVLASEHALLVIPAKAGIQFLAFAVSFFS